MLFGISSKSAFQSVVLKRAWRLGHKQPNSSIVFEVPVHRQNHCAKFRQDLNSKTVEQLLLTPQMRTNKQQPNKDKDTKLQGLIKTPLIPFEFNGSHSDKNMEWMSPDQVKRNEIATKLMLLAADRGYSTSNCFLNRVYKDDTVRNSKLTIRLWDEDGRNSATICSKVIPTFPLDAKHDVNMYIVKNGKRTNIIANEETIFEDYSNEDHNESECKKQERKRKCTNGKQKAKKKSQRTC